MVEGVETDVFVGAPLAAATDATADEGAARTKWMVWPSCTPALITMLHELVINVSGYSFKRPSIYSREKLSCNPADLEAKMDKVETHCLKPALNIELSQNGSLCKRLLEQTS